MSYVRRLRHLGHYWATADVPARTGIQQTCVLPFDRSTLLTVNEAPVELCSVDFWVSSLW